MYDVYDMNLPNRGSGLELPPTNDIESLIKESNAYDRAEFNREAFRLLGVWTTNAEYFLKLHFGDGAPAHKLSLKLTQMNSDPIAKKVTLETGSLEIIEADEKAEKVISKSFIDLGKTALDGSPGLVFTTVGNWSEDINEAIYIPSVHTSELRVFSHLLTNNPK